MSQQPELNVNKTVEVIVDFRKKVQTHPPLVINNSSVTVVEHFKFLGTTITKTLKWDNNITQLVKKGQQCLFFLRQLRTTGQPPHHGAVSQGYH